jgi:hypothetical protein
LHLPVQVNIDRDKVRDVEFGNLSEGRHDYGQAEARRGHLHCENDLSCLVIANCSLQDHVVGTHMGRVVYSKNVLSICRVKGDKRRQRLGIISNEG